MSWMNNALGHLCRSPEEDEPLDPDRRARRAGSAGHGPGHDDLRERGVRWNVILL
jgi:hypothetical protein